MNFHIAIAPPRLECAGTEHLELQKCYPYLAHLNGLRSVKLYGTVSKSYFDAEDICNLCNTTVYRVRLLCVALNIWQTDTVRVIPRGDLAFTLKALYHITTNVNSSFSTVFLNALSSKTIGSSL
jgi:hypothetical protein